MSNFPPILEAVYQMSNSDLCVVGVHLGYEWNQVCHAIQHVGFYAEDGDGSFNVNRYGNDDVSNPTYSENPIIQHIMSEIFKNYPDVHDISIVN